MEKADFNFFFPFRVRYAEVDVQGVVFNANYLLYFDTAINEYFRALSQDNPNQEISAVTDFHTVKALVEFKSPIYDDQEIEVYVRVSRLGRSSITFDLAIYPKDGETLFSTGEVVWVYVDQISHRSAPVPEELVRVIRDMEGERLEP